jgi:undecaprenyl pyrophosphate phosphatase UppP
LRDVSAWADPEGLTELLLVPSSGLFLAVPAIMGVKPAQLAVSRGDISTGGRALLVGVGVRALTGYPTADFPLSLVRGRKLRYFAMCWAVGGTLAVCLGLRGW